jgi:hypothetical protein
MDPAVPVGRWSQPSSSAAASGSIRRVREHRDVVTVPIHWRWWWTSGRAVVAGEATQGEAARCGRESVDGGRFLLRFEDTEESLLRSYRSTGPTYHGGRRGEVGRGHPRQRRG